MARFTSNKGKLRAQLFAEQKGLCWLCGELMTMKKRGKKSGGAKFATFEHVIPKIKGGTNSVSNLKLTHFDCNQRRGAKGYMRQPLTQEAGQEQK